jgi:transposase InsO family protein
MNSHENARLTPKGRARLVERMEQIGVEAAAVESGVSARTALKWKARLKREGEAGLRDRSSRPKRLRAVLTPEQREQALQLRGQRLPIRAIADRLQRPYATVRRFLAGRGLNRLPPLQTAPPIVRYERERPGEMLHLDTKKLGRIQRTGHRVTGNRRDHVRGAGWEALHLAVDDHSRLAYTEVLPDEGQDSTTGFLLRALEWFAGLGVTVERVLTDNGSAYRSKAFGRALADRRIRHSRTRPYTPRTNGKAERFVQTALREWAYAYAYRHSAERTDQLAFWQHHYNHHRKHTAIGFLPPISRIRGNNVSNLNN